MAPQQPRHPLPPRAAHGDAAGSCASGAQAGMPAGPSGAAAAPLQSSDSRRRPTTPPRAQRARTTEDYAARWRRNVEGSEWGPRYWSYNIKCWMYIAENNDEFVYIRDL
eukprot:7258776-Pyramimonas_sp.AAC.1